MELVRPNISLITYSDIRWKLFRLWGVWLLRTLNF